jgi:hypothetical protein
MQHKQNPQNVPVDHHGSADDIFILSYDGQHHEFSRELIQKSNERFEWNGGYIPHRNTGLVEYFGILQRSALVTTMANDPQLKSYNKWPLTPIQSDLAIKTGNLPQHDKFSEDIAWVLYDTKGLGSSYNLREADALKKSILDHRNALNLSRSDLEEKLLVVNAGLETDSKMPHGVKPAIIPGITQACPYRMLNANPDNFINKDNDFHGLYVLRRERLSRPPTRGISLTYTNEPSWLIKINPEWSENVCYFGTLNKEEKKAISI